ncbi:hypothetical protein L484_026030 [Morus notabilis]|uniref:Uncharacterized protein n=1 Tax=Morus notabilis TaxID=981085 RepID=W9RWL1_9ROSA|nr:hypothetical protein L484_026030 [Morus notabilis]
MVCQAASQTRFRALKHENGIAGSATIIVRVIACFQPLQDCQVIVLVEWVKIVEPGIPSLALIGNHPILILWVPHWTWDSLRV